MDPWFYTTAILLILLILVSSFWLTQRRNARARREERRRLLRRISDFVLILDENLTVKMASRTAIFRMPWNIEDLVGRHINSTPLWPKHSTARKDALHAIRMALHGQASVINYEINFEKGRNARFQLKVFPVPAENPGFSDIFCVGRDITVEVETKQILDRQASVEHLIASIAEAAFSTAEIRDCVPWIMEESGRFLGARRAFFFHTDDKDTILWESLWTRPGAPVLINNWQGMNVRRMMPIPIYREFSNLVDLPNNPNIPEEFRRQAALAGMGSLSITALAVGDGPIMGYAGFSFNEIEPPDDPSASILLKMIAATMTGLLSRIGAQRGMERFRQSVDAAGQGIVLIDDEGLITYANQAYTDLTGRKANAADPVWSSYPKPFSSKVESLILPVVRQGERWVGELVIHGSDGSPINTIESFYPIDQGSGAPLVVVNIITDITERKQLEGQLIAAKKEADLANRAKSDYLANMSHEIRTPMNAVIGLTYLAMQTDLDQRQRDYLEKIDVAAKGLLAVINDILDLTKIESGKLELETQEFSMDQVLENVGMMAADIAQGKGVRLYTHRPANMPDRWIGDRFRLGQVLLNLVTNAVKFTHRGRVVVRVAVENPGIAKFIVEDTGIGMTEDQLERLFTPFHQAEASTTREYGGTGLGLTISKQIVELMDGSISVSSSKNEGSRFEFTARMDPADNIEAPATPEAFIGKKAFVVSGDPEARMIHADALRGLGLDVTVCSSTREALENPSYPSITLLDIDVCCVDPAKTAFALSDGNPPEFRLILCGSMNAADLASVAPLGVQTVILPLPYTPSQMSDRLFGQPLSVESAVPPGKRGNFASSVARKRILLADDNAVNRQVAGDLLGRSGLEVESVVNGEEAVASARSKTYDLVLLDLHMPEMDGYRAASIIHREYPDLPIIAMTASALADINAEMDKAGFSGYLPKPVDPDHLYQVVGDAINLPLALIKDKDARDSGEDILQIPGIDITMGLRQVLGDRERFMEILRRFAADYEDFSNRLNDAHQAGDPKTMTALLHSLRGASGNIGAKEIQGLSREMEEGLRQGEIPILDQINALSNLLESLIAEIPGSGSHDERINAWNELEDLIRLGDEKAGEWINNRFGGMKRSSDRDAVSAIKTALDNWDYETALEELDAWRIR